MLSKRFKLSNNIVLQGYRMISPLKSSPVRLKNKKTDLLI